MSIRRTTTPFETLLLYWEKYSSGDVGVTLTDTERVEHVKVESKSPGSGTAASSIAETKEGSNASQLTNRQRPSSLPSREKCSVKLVRKKAVRKHASIDVVRTGQGGDFTSESVRTATEEKEEKETIPIFKKGMSIDKTCSYGDNGNETGKLKKTSPKVDVTLKNVTKKIESLFTTQKNICETLNNSYEEEHHLRHDDRNDSVTHAASVRTKRSNTDPVSHFERSLSKPSGQVICGDELQKSELEDLLTTMRNSKPVGTLQLHSGPLYVRSSSKKELLQQEFLLTETLVRVDYQGKNQRVVLKDAVPAGIIVSIGKVANTSKLGAQQQPLYFFEVHTGAVDGKNYTFGSTSDSDRALWLYKILSRMTNIFPTIYTWNLDEAGKACMKQGIMGTWCSSWLLLKGKSLLYRTKDKELEVVDLRKTRSIELQEESLETGATGLDGKYIILFVHVDRMLYLKMETETVTKQWASRLQAAACNNGRHIAAQQLTQADVPVVVEKCISFIYMHGCMSPGIYQQSGTYSKATRLLEQFKENAWAVHLAHNELTEHDVAKCLLTYFQTLPEPLITYRLYSSWISAYLTLESQTEERLRQYEELLKLLPPINHSTLQRVVGHLHSIDAWQEDNHMDAANLAMVWGPALMSTGDRGLMYDSVTRNHFYRDVDAGTYITVMSSELEVLYSGDNQTSESRTMSVLKKQISREDQPVAIHNDAYVGITTDLINNYQRLFCLSDEEMHKEKQMKEAVSLVQSRGEHSKMGSSEFWTWAHIYTKTYCQCFRICVLPLMTAYDVCTQLIQRGGLKDSVNGVTLFEVVSQGELERPLPSSELVLGVLLHWANWTDVDRRDNYLVLRKNGFLKMLPQVELAEPLLSQLQYASDKSKGFKRASFLFASSGEIAYFKGREVKGEAPYKTWSMQDILWYVGAESRRQAPTPFCLTFVDRYGKVGRSKASPYFGRTLCFDTAEEYSLWLAAFIKIETPNIEFGCTPSTPEEISYL